MRALRGQSKVGVELLFFFLGLRAPSVVSNRSSEKNEVGHVGAGRKKRRNFHHRSSLDLPLAR